MLFRDVLGLPLVSHTKLCATQTLKQDCGKSKAGPHLGFRRQIFSGSKRSAFKFQKRASIQKTLSASLEFEGSKVESHENEETQLESLLRQSLTSGGSAVTPLLDDADLLTEDVVLESDLSTFKGRDIYLAAGVQWRKKQYKDLPECALKIERISQIGPDEVLVRWNATWMPPGLQKLAAIARNWPGGLEIEYYDILDKVDQVAKSSFFGVVKLFWRAATERKMRIPIARVWATSKYVFKEQPIQATLDEGSIEPESDENPGASVLSTPESRYCLARQIDSFDLYPLFQREGVKNRRVTKDFVLFLDTRRPPDTNTGEWDDQIWNGLNLREVPGMSPLEVDSVDTSSQAFEDASAVLAVLVLATLVFGCSIGYNYFQQLQRAAEIRQLMEL